MNSNELEWIKKRKKELHFLKLLKKSELQIMNDELISSKTESCIKQNTKIKL